VHVRPGSRNPAYATAVGKVLLAELEDDAIEALAERHGLPQLTPSTITTAAELLEQVHGVRAQGYALNSEEAYPGIGAIATVVRDVDGGVRCAISLSYATSLLGADDLPAWVERTAAAAHEISAALAGVERRVVA
jgi:DNA-binding IclR family transcriptional regulator